MTVHTQPILIGLGLAGLLFTGVNGAAISPVEPPPPITQVVDANNHLASQFLAAMPGKVSEDFVLAPYGVTNVLIALKPGAAGQTATEITTLLKLWGQATPQTLTVGSRGLRDCLGIATALSFGLEGTPLSSGGIKVTKVGDSSVAAQAGIKLNDVILALNGKPISGVDELDKSLAGAAAMQMDVQSAGGGITKVVLIRAAPASRSRLRSSTALWGQSGLKFEPGYLDFANQFATGSIRPADFTKGDAARQTINRWAEAESDGVIKNFLGPSDVTGETRLVVANTLFFDAAWASPFNPDVTEQAPFNTVPASSEPVTVPLMTQQGIFPYLKGEGFQAVELPYDGGKYAFALVVPDQLDGLPAVVATLARLPSVAPTGYSDVLVRVSLPRFSIRTRTDLKPILAAAGMSSAFDPSKADFSGISREAKGLYVSAFVQSAFIDVGEKGTRAGAATAAVLGGRSRPNEPKARVVADRPFAFMITDKATGAVLFVGKCVNPKGDLAPKQ